MAEISQKHVSSKKSLCCCVNTTHIIYINPQLHFISVDSLRAFVAGESLLTGLRLVATRIRNIWYKFRKWLKYQPHRTYLRGK